MSDIGHPYPLILNKVASPHYAMPVLRRGRLLDWLGRAAGCRAVVIAADAGYGKTTLLWQWEREVGFPCYWYKLDRNDRDWTFHIRYLVEAVRGRHKGFGERAHAMLRQLGGPGSSRPGVAAYLLADMHDRLTEACTFLIDDWQYVNAATEVRGLWNQILRDAPPTCRFVFASRVKPRLQFARFKTHNGFANLDTDALRFTEPEIVELFRDVYGDPLEPEEVVELERRTEGWAASLQLVEVSLRERSTAGERHRFISSITATKDSDLFDFLAEEVLEQQTAETRNFLLSTSILQQITPEVAERLAGVHDGRRELSELEDRGLFTNRLDEHRYRYHNLFRDFLERHLLAERSKAEVVGLHIHAASYFETTEQWPEAIHHYLRAGLQRQAARLIAKYGEDVVAGGGLGLVDEWLRELPTDAVRQNARLSLLHGEACGIRGEWPAAVEALQRARNYFARKGDRRFEALACLKLSTVHINYGDIDRAAVVADAGVELVPQDGAAIRLRLEGNLAVTRTWLTRPLAEVVDECQRIAVEASSLGLDHFAAIGFHNAGGALLSIGRLGEAVEALQRAAKFWSDPPTSPFADSLDYVTALLLLGHVDLARTVAIDAVRRTQPWERPNALARCALGTVFVHQGRFSDAIGEFRAAGERRVAIGALHNQLSARLIETIWLAGQPLDEIADAAEDLFVPPFDVRYTPDLVAARAIARHVSAHCDGECQNELSALQGNASRGEILAVLIAEVKIGALAIDHDIRADRVRAWDALSRALGMGLGPHLRWWLRRYSTRAALPDLRRRADTVELLEALLGLDATGWRTALVDVAKATRGSRRGRLWSLVEQFANRTTTESLSDVPGSDVAEVRRRLIHAQARRIFIRTLGGMSVHRGGWTGPELAIEKRRVRALLGVLAAHAGRSVTRDVAIDLMWPDADGDAAVNSLNQTVFQLRRCLDPGYRGGDSPEYIVSTSEQIGLNGELVITDLTEIARLANTAVADARLPRQSRADRLLDLMRGEFLADFPYEDWATRLRSAVHNDVRRAALPIAQNQLDYSADTRLRAAECLLALDSYDELAVIAMAVAMEQSGRKVFARELIVAYVDRVRRDFDDEPSAQFAAAAAAIGEGSVRIKRVLTSGESQPSRG